MSPETNRAAFLDLLPTFLRRRRQGWTGLNDLITESGVARTALFLLHALVEEFDPQTPFTRSDMEQRLFNPYSAIFPFMRSLPELITAGYVTESGDQLQLTNSGIALITRMEYAAQSYLATTAIAADPIIQPTVQTLQTIATALWQAPEPAIKAHQARLRRIPLLPDTPAIVLLEQAIFALWLARDDAHIAAWNAQGLTGPAHDILTYLWRNPQSYSLTDLQTTFAQTQLPADVSHNLASLANRGLIIRNTDTIDISLLGTTIRAAIETETDRLYFTPWHPDALTHITSLTANLQTITDGLPQAPTT